MSMNAPIHKHRLWQKKVPALQWPKTTEQEPAPQKSPTK